MEIAVLYIVIPCFNEEEVLLETNTRLLSLLISMIEEGVISERSRLLYVNDGSSDSTWSLIELFHDNDNHVRGVNLSSNCGHQNALMAGMSVSKELADCIVTIDADLQDDISVIPQMVNYFLNGVDIVYGVRKGRSSDTFLKKIQHYCFIS